MGNDINILSLDAMKKLYEIMAANLKLTQEKGDPQEQPMSTKTTTRRHVIDSKSC